MVHDGGESDDSLNEESKRLGSEDEVATKEEQTHPIEELENEPLNHGNKEDADDDEDSKEDADDGEEEDITSDSSDGTNVVELDEDEAAAVEDTPTAVDDNNSTKVVGPSGIDKDRLDSRIDSIRARRGSGKREGFPRTFEDLLLIAGCMYAMLYAVLLVAAPMIEPVRESFIIDEKLSATPLDTGEHPCNVPNEGKIAEIYPDNDGGNIIVWLTGVQKTNTNTFIYPSSNNPHRNNNLLLKAFILAAGKTDQQIELKITIKESNINIYKNTYPSNLKVEYLGIIDHKRLLKIYKSSKFLIFPSLRESFGLPLIEGIQAGCIILAPKLNYVNELISPAYSFDVNNLNSISKTILKAIRNKNHKLQSIKVKSDIDKIFKKLINV